LTARTLRLDFDVSHFEVVGVPMQESVPRLLPLANAVEIKDQQFRYVDDVRLPPAGWSRAMASDAPLRLTGDRSSTSSCWPAKAPLIWLAT